VPSHFISTIPFLKVVARRNTEPFLIELLTFSRPSATAVSLANINLPIYFPVLAEHQVPMPDFDNLLHQFLDISPFSLGPSPVIDGNSLPSLRPTERVLRFCMGLVTFLPHAVTRMPLQKIAVHFMHVTRALLNENARFMAPRFIELSMEIMAHLLEEKDLLAVLGQMPAVLQMWAPHIQELVIEKKPVDALRQALMQPSASPQTNQRRVQWLFQLVPPLAPLLFRDPSFFPIDCRPSVCLSTALPKELYPLYQNALRSAVLASPDIVPDRIVCDIFDMTKEQNVKLTPSFGSPFATVCQWMNDAQGEARLFGLISLLLDVLKPASSPAVIVSFASLKQPLHRDVLVLIGKLLENDFPELKNYYLHYPPSAAGPRKDWIRDPVD
jgi:hypothetical protein